MNLRSRILRFHALEAYTAGDVICLGVVACESRLRERYPSSRDSERTRFIGNFSVLPQIINQCLVMPEGYNGGWIATVRYFVATLGAPGLLRSLEKERVVHGGGSGLSGRTGIVTV